MQLAVAQHAWRRGDLARVGVAATTLAVAVVAAVTGAALQFTSADARAEAGVPTPAGGPAANTSTVPPLAASVPTGLRIPAIELDTTSLVQLRDTPAGGMEVPAEATAVGWFGPDEVTPGESGAAVLAAHTELNREPGAFQDLRLLRRGDTIIVSRADGTAPVFTVYSVKRTAGIETAVALARTPTDLAELRLLTWPGDEVAEAAAERTVVVFAELSAPR